MASLTRNSRLLQIIEGRHILVFGPGAACDAIRCMAEFVCTSSYLSVDTLFIVSYGFSISVADRSLLK